MDGTGNVLECNCSARRQLIKLDSYLSALTNVAGTGTAIVRGKGKTEKEVTGTGGTRRGGMLTDTEGLPRGMMATGDARASYLECRLLITRVLSMV